jgi:hypothetical protein
MRGEFTVTAEFEHLSVALKSFWDPFNELLTEMDSFVPRPLSDFDKERTRLFEGTKRLNPNLSDDEIRNSVEKRIESSESAEWQFYAKFSDRFMTMDVTVTLLSQALCEAEINAILAIGFHEGGIADQFAKIERGDIRKKWLEYPKKFCPKYELNKDSELYRTLDHLIEHRNAWMHHKIHLSVGNETIIEGSKLRQGAYQARIHWLKRYFSLPYDLAAHAHSHTRQGVAAMMFFTRSPILVADVHARTP